MLLLVKLKIDGLVKKLRDQLIALQSIPSETEKAKESKVEMTKTAMKSFITTSLDMGIDVHIIQMALENLHTKDTDIVIDGDTYQWCKVEIQKQNTVRNPVSESSSLEQVPEEQPFSEVNFGEVIVQNSLLACHLLDSSSLKSASDYLAYPHSLSEVNKSEFLSLEGKEEKNSQPEDDFLESCTRSDMESSASDSNLAESPKKNDREIPWPLLSPNAIHSAPIHQYLIAKGLTKPDNHEVYYMAFSSHQSLKEWNCGHISFEDGMPSLFFIGGRKLCLEGVDWERMLAALLVRCPSEFSNTPVDHCPSPSVRKRIKINIQCLGD